MSDLLLAKWIEEQFNSRKKAYKREKDQEKREKILYSLAKLLRQYINTLKTKSGLGHEQKKTAHQMTEWLQSEMLKGEWSANLSYCFDTIIYAGKHAGNVADEGRALRSNLTKSERDQLDSLTRKAQQRFERSLGELDSKDINRVDDLRSLGLVDDRPELDEAGDIRRFPDDDYDNS